MGLWIEPIILMSLVHFMWSPSLIKEWLCSILDRHLKPKESLQFIWVWWNVLCLGTRFSFSFCFNYYCFYCFIIACELPRVMLQKICLRQLYKTFKWIHKYITFFNCSNCSLKEMSLKKKYPLIVHNSLRCQFFQCFVVFVLIRSSPVHMVSLILLNNKQA